MRDSLLDFLHSSGLFKPLLAAFQEEVAGVAQTMRKVVSDCQPFDSILHPSKGSEQAWRSWIAGQVETKLA